MGDRDRVPFPPGSESLCSRLLVFHTRPNPSFALLSFLSHSSNIRFSLLTLSKLTYVEHAKTSDVFIK